MKYNFIASELKNLDILDVEIIVEEPKTIEKSKDMKILGNKEFISNSNLPSGYK